VAPSGGRVTTYLQCQAILAGQPENPGAGHLSVARSDMEWFGRKPGGLNQNLGLAAERGP